MDASKYRINPDFEPREPTPANFFATISREEYDRGEFGPIFDRWREEGCKHLRLTLVNDEYPHPPYPHGVYLEGWLDPYANCLPFGEAEKPGGAIYPCLTAKEPRP